MEYQQRRLFYLGGAYPMKDGQTRFTTLKEK